MTATLTHFAQRLIAGLLSALVLALGGSAQAADSRPRFALVIGIADYDHHNKLANTANDADLMSASLRGVGFEVMARTDPSGPALRGAIDNFAARIAAAHDPVVVFYYAGQGVQAQGVNYLIPRDANIKNAEDPKTQALSLNYVIDSITGANPSATAVLFFDASSEDPFATPAATRGFKPKPGERGLAPVAVNGHMALMFATSPGSQVLDGAGSNGPFALAIAKNLKAPGLEFADFARLVRDDVLASTNGYQRPWVQTSLTEPFYFNAEGAPLAPGKDAKTRAAEVFYEPQPGELVSTYEDRSYALLVGVSDYDDRLKAWRDLPAVKDEIQDLARTLEVMHGFKVTTVLDPTGQELEAAIKDFVNEHGSKINARLVFFLSGHGVTIENKLTRKKVGWFVPRDAPHYVDSPIPFANIALNMSRIAEWSEMMEAKHVLWVFDSCFSGVALRMMARKGDDGPKHWEAYLHKAPVRRVITAGSENEEVPAESRFTRQFTRVLRGELSVGDQDELVTGQELGDFLKKDVVDFSYGTDLPQTPQSDTIIIPDIDSGDIVFRIEPELSAGLTK
ncbi:MAG: caspase domain-containing protein [Parvibaculaceae bacterium]